MRPEADLRVREMGFPPANDLVRELSYPKVAFGCAAHNREHDSGAREERYGVSGGGAGIATPKALPCRQLKDDEEEAATGAIRDAVPQLRGIPSLDLTASSSSFCH